ncbi:MAG: hypothetical protein LBP80_10415 [Treponema sp.]|jgi:hypothetical protein|nr:hypothetical protein [Treponema sp.]
MKKNTWFSFIVLAMALTFALVPVGCATAKSGGGSPAAGGEDRPYTGISVPAGRETLAGALAWIGENAAEGGAYTVTFKAGETIPAHRLSYGGKRVRISLLGDAAGREVLLDGRGALFTVESGVTLSVENLTLKGRGNSADAANDRALVQAHSGGVLKLPAG